MEPLGFHLVFRVGNDLTAAPTPAARRALATALLAAAQPFPLLAFRWVDTHGHAVTAGDRAAAGECARRIEIAVSKRLRLDVDFAPVRIKPILDAPHLRNTFLYVLGQDAHHGVAVDPTFDASNVPDLLGARVIGAWTTGRVRAHLPRIRRSDILKSTGLADPVDAPCALDALADATAAAIGRSTLDGREAIVVNARRAAVHVAHEEGTAAIAEALGITAAGVRKLRSQVPDTALVRAVSQQLGLRAATSAAAGNDPLT